MPSSTDLPEAPEESRSEPISIPVIDLVSSNSNDFSKDRPSKGIPDGYNSNNTAVKLLSQSPDEEMLQPVIDVAIANEGGRQTRVRFSSRPVSPYSSSASETGDHDQGNSFDQGFDADEDVPSTPKSFLSPTGRKHNGSSSSRSTSPSSSGHRRRPSTMRDEISQTTLFTGKTFKLHGFSPSKIRDLENIIKYHGGEVTVNVTRETSFYISVSPDIGDLNELDFITKHRIPLLSESYILSVSNGGKVEDISPYILHRDLQSTKPHLMVNSGGSSPSEDSDHEPARRRTHRRKMRSIGDVSHAERGAILSKMNLANNRTGISVAKYLNVDKSSDEGNDTDEEYLRRPLGDMNVLDGNTTSDTESIYDQDDTDRRFSSYPKVLDPIDITEGNFSSPTGFPVTAESRERIEWQSMLVSVLTGEILNSEKKRISGTLIEENKAINVRYDLWLGIRARVRGSLPAKEQKYLEEARKNLDIILKEVIDFHVRLGEGMASPEDQVNSLLKMVDQCESLFPTIKAFLSEKSIYSSEEFQMNLSALTSWQNMTKSLHTQLSILQRWTGRDDLDVTVPKGNINTKTLDGKTTFIERILKEEGLHKTFDGQTLTDVNQLVHRAKSIMIENHESFKRIGLPLYMDDLLKLINFPTRLMEECLKFQLGYADRLNDPTMLMVDQFLDDFRVALREGCRIKINYQNIAEGGDSPQWRLPPCIDKDYDSMLTRALTFFFKLLSFKLKSKSKAILFKEAEILEQEWDFLLGICHIIEGGDVMVAEQFSSLTNRLLGRLIDYFNMQIRTPCDRQESEVAAHYGKVLENVRVRHRKLLRFSRVLSSQFENSAEYHFTSDGLPTLMNKLVATGHFMVYTGIYEAKGIYFIAESSLFERPATVRDIICRSFCKRAADESNSTSDYVLILSPRDAFAWMGQIIQCPNIPSTLDFGLRSGRVRLVTDGSTFRLASCKSRFQKALAQQPALEIVAESRSNMQSVDRELHRIKKTAFRLAESIIYGVGLLRQNLQGKRHQDIVENFFAFATEFGQRAIRYLDSNTRRQLNLMLIRLAIDWTGFISDDCTSSDRRTFRWAMTSLEFAMMMTRGNNILDLSEQEFTLLRSRVAACMTLLISQIDVMGARSHQEKMLERERQEAIRQAAAAKKHAERTASVDQVASTDINPYDHRNNTALSSVSYVREEWLRQLNEIDERRTTLLQERHRIGKVLDYSHMEDSSLAFLVASSTNISIRWQQGRFIGGGSFGSVYLAVNLDSNELMAVKEIRFQDTQSLPGLLRSIRDEMSVMSVLNHPNIVQYYGIEVHRDKVYIFMEFCQGGSLANLLEHGRIEDEAVIQFYIWQMLQGLAYLHSNGIIHRDVKPDNILLDHQGTIKFVDFGAAKILVKNQRTRGRTITADDNGNNGLTGTPMYMSPEVITNDVGDQQSSRRGAMDIWSMGCCAIEMAAGRRPWPNLDNEWAVMFHVVQGLPPLPDESQLSVLGIDFIRQCLTRNPSSRPTADELLEHPWIREIQEALDSYKEGGGLGEELEARQPLDVVPREELPILNLETVVEEVEGKGNVSPMTATQAQNNGLPAIRVELDQTE